MAKLLKKSAFEAPEMDIEAFLILLQIILIQKEKQKPVQGKNIISIFVKRT